MIARILSVAVVSVNLSRFKGYLGFLNVRRPLL